MTDRNHLCSRLLEGGLFAIFGLKYILRSESELLSESLLFGVALLASGILSFLWPHPLQWLFRWEAPTSQVREWAPGWLRDALTAVIVLGLVGALLA